MRINRWFSEETLALTESDLLGSGSKRLCFIFPQNERLCVKVARSELSWNQAHRQSFTELAYLSYLKRRDGCHPNIFPEVHGWVRTNYGAGLVMDRVVGCDGQGLMTLWQLLDRKQMTAAEAIRIMNELKQHAVEQRYLISDWNTTNVIPLVKSNGRMAMMVDGFGPKSRGTKGFVFSRIGMLARLKTERSWRSQRIKVEKSIQDSSAGKEI